MAPGIASVTCWTMAVATFWVVAYEHGARRQDDGNHRCQLPQHPDLLELLSRGSQSQESEAATRGPYLAGLMRAAPGRAHHAQFTFEERCLHSYFGMHERCYSLKVIEFCETVEHLSVFECIFPPSQRPWNLNTSISLPVQTYRYVEVKRGSGAVQTVEDTMQDWLQLPHDVSDDQLLNVRLIAVVEPVMRLIAASRWHSVMLPMPHRYQGRRSRSNAFRLPQGQLAENWQDQWPPACDQLPHQQEPHAAENVFQMFWRVQRFLQARAEAGGEDQDSAQDLAAAMFRGVNQLEGEPMGPMLTKVMIPTSEYLSLALLALLQRSTEPSALEMPRA